MSSLITAHVDQAGKVLGVHGGSGPMSWLRAATGSHLYGDWDGIEWVAFEPGDRAGLHTHSHTEEMWFFLRGTGTIELDGSRHDVAPGSIVLTPLGSSHAAWNTGADRLEYVVIEVFPPRIRDVLPPRRPTDEWPLPPTAPDSSDPGSGPVARRPGGLVTRLEENAVLDPRPYLDGAWHSFCRVSIDDGGTFAPARDREHSLVVMSGGGVVSTPGVEARVEPGSFVTAGLGSALTLRADRPTEVFATTLAVAA